MPPEFSLKMSHLGIPDLLSEVCRDNKGVLTNIGESMIDHFISILRQARDFKYINLLADVSFLFLFYHCPITLFYISFLSMLPLIDYKTRFAYVRAHQSTLINNLLSTNYSTSVQIYFSKHVCVPNSKSPYRTTNGCRSTTSSSMVQVSVLGQCAVYLWFCLQ